VPPEQRTLLVAAIALVVGCAGREEAVLLGDPTGQWTVVGHAAPGIRAMSDSEAVAWYGREARFGAANAVFHEDRCDQATYHSSGALADSLFGNGFRVAPNVLGFRAGETVTLTTIACGGSDWVAPGSWLAWKSRDTVYTNWDGVFFMLVRRRD